MKDFFLRGVAGMMIIIATLASGGFPALYVYKAIDGLNLSGMAGEQAAEGVALLMGILWLIVIWAFVLVILFYRLEKKTGKTFYKNLTYVFGATCIIAAVMGLIVSLVFGFTLFPVITGIALVSVVGVVVLLFLGKKLYDVIFVNK